MGWRMGGFPFPWKIQLSSSLLQSVPAFAKGKSYVRGAWNRDVFLFETDEKGHEVDGLTKSMYRAFAVSEEGTGLEQVRTDPVILVYRNEISSLIDHPHSNTCRS